MTDQPSDEGEEAARKLAACQILNGLDADTLNWEEAVTNGAAIIAAHTEAAVKAERDILKAEQDQARRAVADLQNMFDRDRTKRQKAEDEVMLLTAAVAQARLKIAGLVEGAEGCPVGHGLCGCPSTEDCVLGAALAALAPPPGGTA